MGLALQTDYALRVLLYLATKPGRATASEIADFFGISPHHASKSVHELARRGYLRSRRGAGGGIELAKSPQDINIGELIEQFEGSRLQLLECVAVDGVCVIQPGCKLRTVLAKAERLQQDYLRTVRLSDLVEPDKPLVSLTSDRM